MFWRFWIMAAAFILPLQRIEAADVLPPAGWPDVESVSDFLADVPHAGQRASVVGYPVCETAAKCALMAAPHRLEPQVPFDALKLNRDDRMRLLNCLAPALLEPCSAVLYGTSDGDHGMTGQRIWWRSYEH